MTVLKYETLEEAVTIANGTRYGLGASVFGKNKLHCEYIVDNIQSGMVCTNGELSFLVQQSGPEHLLIVLLLLADFGGQSPWPSAAF